MPLKSMCIMFRLESSHCLILSTKKRPFPSNSGVVDIVADSELYDVTTSFPRTADRDDAHTNSCHFTEELANCERI